MMHYIEPATTAIPRTISARLLAHANWTQRRRAEAAARVLDGDVILCDFSKTQIATLFTVSVSSIRRANSNTKPKKAFTDAEVDRLVDRVGADKILAALDRRTSPQLALVAAE